MFWGDVARPAGKDARLAAHLTTLQATKASTTKSVCTQRKLTSKADRGTGPQLAQR